jgi:hypothetical protein
MNRTAKVLLLSALTALLLLWAGYFVGHIPSVQDALIREVAGEALGSTRFDLLDKTGLSPAAIHAPRAQLPFCA